MFERVCANQSLCRKKACIHALLCQVFTQPAPLPSPPDVQARLAAHRAAWERAALGRLRKVAEIQGGAHNLRQLPHPLIVAFGCCSVSG